MPGIYRPGWESKTYRSYPRSVRDQVAAEVDKQFRKETNVNRQLDPTSKRDLELRRTWLRIRDRLVADRTSLEIRNARVDSLLTEIPHEMEWNHWNEGAELLRKWFERPPTIAPKYSAPVTNVVKIDWVLQFARAKSVFDTILKDQIWTNPAAQTRLTEFLKKQPSTDVNFGDLNKPVTQIDDMWINSRPVFSGFDQVDGLTAALGNFQLQVAISGKVVRNGLLPGCTPLYPPTGLSLCGSDTANVVTLEINEIGIYAKDSLDFNEEQFLGVWGYRDDPVSNKDFREWRANNNLGGDFMIFSDVKRIRRNPPDKVVLRLPR